MSLPDENIPSQAVIIPVEQNKVVPIEFQQNIVEYFPRDIEDRYCEICFSETKDTAFDCGHVFCRNCSSKLDKCPKCRKKITKKTKLFLY